VGRKLQPVEVVTAVEAQRRKLPERVEAALGELVGAAQEGLLALSVGVGLGVLAELMEEEVSEVVGPRSKPDPERRAYRHGHERGEVVLGGRVLPIERPRVRAKDGSAELPLQTYQHRDPLARVVLWRCRGPDVTSNGGGGPYDCQSGRLRNRCAGADGRCDFEGVAGHRQDGLAELDKRCQPLEDFQDRLGSVARRVQ